MADDGDEDAEVIGLICSSGEMQTYTSFLYGTFVALGEGDSEPANNEVDGWDEGVEELLTAFGIDEPESKLLGYDVDQMWRAIWLGEEVEIGGDDIEEDDGGD